MSPRDLADNHAATVPFSGHAQRWMAAAIVGPSL
ncbi:hypothetical protein DE4576_04871 [Mycobacterium marinum]|nr:hypothetical protein DE4576_04871 [Mycobacterium marinum]